MTQLVGINDKVSTTSATSAVNKLVVKTKQPQLYEVSAYPLPISISSIIADVHWVIGARICVSGLGKHEPVCIYVLLDLRHKPLTFKWNTKQVSWKCIKNVFCNMATVIYRRLWITSAYISHTKCWVDVCSTTAFIHPGAWRMIRGMYWITFSFVFLL